MKKFLIEWWESLLITLSLMLIFIGISINVPWLLIVGCILSTIGLVILIFMLYIRSTYSVFMVTDLSMTPTLSHGSIRLIRRTDKLNGSKLYELVKSKDLVLISNKNYQFNEEVPDKFMRRLVLLGSGYVKCVKGTIYTKPNADAKWVFWGSIDHYAPKYYFSEYHCKHDEIFFIGDAVHISIDSRHLDDKSYLNFPYNVKDIVGIDITDKLPDKVKNILIKLLSKKE